jgi:hypothetical protein
MVEIVLIVAFGAAFLIERHLGRRWSAGYCTAGIRVFRRKCQAFHPQDALPRTESMELRFIETEWPTLDFKWVDGSHLAFHENYAGAKMAYTQVMRGCLRFDRKTGTVEVVGFLNYFVLLLASAFVVVSLADGNPQGLIFIPLALLVFGACYATQVGRYNEVLSAAAAEWGNQDVESMHAG